MERSANAYPWSYNEEEDGGERTEDWTDDEEEGERRLREIWDDEVERKRRRRVSALRRGRGIGGCVGLYQTFGKVFSKVAVGSRKAESRRKLRSGVPLSP